MDLNVNGLKKASVKAADGCNTIITELKQIFLSDAREPKVGFLHSWVVFSPLFFGKSSL